MQIICKSNVKMKCYQKTYDQCSKTRLIISRLRKLKRKCSFLRFQPIFSHSDYAAYFVGSFNVKPCGNLLTLPLGKSGHAQNLNNKIFRTEWESLDDTLSHIIACNNNKKYLYSAGMSQQILCYDDSELFASQQQDFFNS